jgi:hypothetical protein
VYPPTPIMRPSEIARINVAVAERNMKAYRETPFEKRL